VPDAPVREAPVPLGARRGVGFEAGIGQSYLYNIFGAKEDALALSK